MDKIIYAKYSNERAPEYCIRTDIIKKESGERVVRKSAYNSLAQGHIDRILENKVLLDQQYQNSPFETNSVEQKQDGLYFEYLEATSFKKELDNLVEQKKYTTLIARIQEFFEALKSTMKIERFVASDAFVNVFGEVELPADLEGVSNTNLDYVFGNILLCDGKYTIIDYEWVADYRVPFLYLIYRALRYYVVETDQKEVTELNLLRVFGISESLEQQFEKMELNFQLHVGTASQAYMYSEMTGTVYSKQDILEACTEKELCEKARVYLDYGDGLSEANAYDIQPVKSDEEYREYQIEYPEGVKAVRFDPCDRFCLLYDLQVSQLGGQFEKVVYSTNGRQLGEQVLLFCTDDPNICISEIPCGSRKLEVSYRLLYLDMQIAVGLLNYQKAIDAQVHCLQSTNQQNLVQIEEKENQLSELTLLHKQMQEEKENKIAELTVLHKQAQEEKENKIAELTVLRAQTQEKENQISLLSNQIVEVSALYEQAQNEKTAWIVQYQQVIQSRSFRITKPLRSIKNVIKKVLKSNKVTYKGAKAVRYLYRNGVKQTICHTKEVLNRRSLAKSGAADFSNIVDENVLQQQREHKFENAVKFSVLVPLYNTPEIYLRAMVESVKSQTYGNWELCIADGSDDKHRNVKKICRKYHRQDKRIKYKKLKKNLGISENTNACIQMATGDYICLFDHDDLLHPSALYENMCAIEQKNADFIYSDENTFHHQPADAFCPHYKPDFSPDTLRSYNYICHFTVFKKTLLDEVGLFRKQFDGSQDYDMILRLTEKAQNIVHIPKIIYYWRAHEASVASDISAKTYCLDAAKNALSEHLNRVGLKGEVQDSRIPSVYKIQYEIIGTPMISILIPNKDHVDDLSKCINSILEKSSYDNYEIIIIENNSEESETFNYYDTIKDNAKINVVYWEGEFNYSAINNFGARYAIGDYILLLNNDVEVITCDWLEQMLMFAQRSDVGAVGAMLYYPDDTIQHAGVILGIGGVAGHSHKNFSRNDYGYASRLALAQNLSAVTAACMLMPKTVFDEVGGLDEGFKVAFNDVDLCMRIRQKGYLIVFTPFAELYHYESKSRGLEDTAEKQERFKGEIDRFQERWGEILKKGDPYYNPNLTLDREDFSMISK